MHCYCGHSDCSCRNCICELYLNCGTVWSDYLGANLPFILFMCLDACDCIHRLCRLHGPSCTNIWQIFDVLRLLQTLIFADIWLLQTFGPSYTNTRQSLLYEHDFLVQTAHNLILQKQFTPGMQDYTMVATFQFFSNSSWCLLRRIIESNWSNFLMLLLVWILWWRQNDLLSVSNSHSHTCWCCMAISSAECQ